MTGKLKQLADWARGYGEGKNHNSPFLPFRSVRLRDFVCRDRICVFHHIPKCAGSTVVNVLGAWFFVVEDYRPRVDGALLPGNRIDTKRLRNARCLVGHFDDEGIYLPQRYPEVLADRRFFLMTFLRDPLATRTSLFFYEKQWGTNTEATLAEHLLTRDNYIAARFPCQADNFRETLDRYDFIGITEQLDESVSQLARLVDRQPRAVPFYNATVKDARSLELAPAVLAEFRRRNALDYALYDYGLDRLNRRR